MTFTLRYRPGTPLGDKFPLWRWGDFADRLTAEDMRDACNKPEQVEVVEVEAA